MKLTIHLEIDDGIRQSGPSTPVPTRVNDFPQRDIPCRISANFVTQVAATFLHCPQTSARRRIDLRDAIQTYNNAVNPTRAPSSTAIHCKT